MTAPDRIPCLRPACRRTAPREKYPHSDIVCGKCWRGFVPPRLKHRYKLLNRLRRNLLRRRTPDPASVDRIDRLTEMNWRAIRQVLLVPARPAGLDAFLEESGL